MYNPGMAIVYEPDSPVAPRSGLGPYRESDYWVLPETPRCELVYGRLLVTPSPLVLHQQVVVRLGRLFLDWADTHQGAALIAPVDVRLAAHSVVQPDLLLVSRERLSILGDRVDGAPDLVVEVLSPATARRDLGEKLRLYVESGVAEYWIVDPQARTLEFLEARDGAFLVRLPEAGLYRSAALAGLELDLEAFWSRIPGPV